MLGCAVIVCSLLAVPTIIRLCRQYVSLGYAFTTYSMWVVGWSHESWPTLPLPIIIGALVGALSLAPLLGSIGFVSRAISTLARSSGRPLPNLG